MTPSTGATAPLAGVQVLDLTNVSAGPFCCHQLPHLGAEVVEVEAPGRGELARQLGADPDLSARGMGASFLRQNAGKRSITVDLKHPLGKAVLRRLVRGADVLVENFRPGVMERLDVGANTLRAENPHLIYAAVSGFEQGGPWRDRPAYDQIVQGVAGVMAVTGTPEGGPLRVGFPVADTIGGLTSAMAVAAALNARPRGCVIDVSTAEAVAATMGWTVFSSLVAGRAPGRVGNEHVASAPSGAFRAADSPLDVAANRDEQRERSIRHLGVEAVLARPPAAEWADEPAAIGGPADPVLDLPETLSHPQVAERGLVARHDCVAGVGRDVEAVRTAVRIDGPSPAVNAPPPELGADADAVLAEAGLSTAEIAALREEGAV